MKNFFNPEWPEGKLKKQKTMKVIEAPEHYEANYEEMSLFLAGGITNCPDWQQELIDLLKNENIVIYNPRRKHFPIDIPDESIRQITWEYNYLKTSDIISFWFSRGSLNPIVLYELGKYCNATDITAFIGVDPEYERKSDVIIQTKLARPDIEIVFSIEDLAKQISNALKTI